MNICKYYGPLSEYCMRSKTAEKISDHPVFFNHKQLHFTSNMCHKGVSREAFLSLTSTYYEMWHPDGMVLTDSRWSNATFSNINKTVLRCVLKMN